MRKLPNKWATVEAVLSDGSVVYDVTNGCCTIYCVDKESADNLVDEIERASEFDD